MTPVSTTATKTETINATGSLYLSLAACISVLRPYRMGAL